MAIKFGMPSLGHTMETGRIIEWLKQEGDPLAKGEPLLVVETDKVTTEVEAPLDGVLVRVLATADEERPIGATLALLSVPGETLDESEIEQLLAAETEVPETVTPEIAASPVDRSGSVDRSGEARSSGGRLKISPVARKMAAELGVDPATVTGTGPRGRITKEDILGAASATGPGTPSTLAASARIPLTGIRGRVAERMLQSWNTIPRVTLTMQVDMSATVDFRESMLQQWQEQYGQRISLNHLISRAVAVALTRHPRLNATLVDGKINLHDRINIGVAVNLDEGLVVPVIHDAVDKDLGQIASESLKLTERARADRLQLDDVADATFTMTNLGSTGIDLLTPIISPPQVAILGLGRIQPRPLVVENELAVRSTAHLCLVFDHRALDGVPAGKFLQELQGLFAAPEEYAS